MDTVTITTPYAADAQDAGIHHQRTLAGLVQHVRTARQDFTHWVDTQLAPVLGIPPGHHRTPAFERQVLTLLHGMEREPVPEQLVAAAALVANYLAAVEKEVARQLLVGTATTGGAL